MVKIATTRDQYVGLKEAVLSTRMNVMGCDDMLGIRRWNCNMLLAEAVSVALGGMKTPSPRNCLTLLVRRREEAEGERRMMGWRRLLGRFWRLETSVGAGREALGSEGRLRRNVAAILRYGEKS